MNIKEVISSLRELHTGVSNYISLNKESDATTEDELNELYEKMRVRHACNTLLDYLGAAKREEKQGIDIISKN